MFIFMKVHIIYKTSLNNEIIFYYYFIYIILIILFI